MEVLALFPYRLLRYTRLLYLVFVCLVTLPPSATIEAHETSGVPLPRSHGRPLSGDWYGSRDTLNRQGITPYATYTTALLGNPVGGQKRGFAYSGDLDFGVAIDLERLWGLPGLVFTASGSWRSGRDLSTQAIGNIFTAAQTVGGTTIRLHNLYLEQSLLGDQLSLLFGRVGMGDEFLTSPLYENFVQTAFNGNVFGIDANLPSFTSYPDASWGFRARIEPVGPNESWYVMGGIYYSDKSLSENNIHGVDFSLRSSAGITAIGQIGYRHNQRQDSTGLPGNYAIGGYYDSGAFPDFSSPQQQETNGNYALYVMLDQMVYREDGSDGEEGLTPFVTASFAPGQDRNTFPYFFATGLVYQGLLPGRDSDVAALGLAYGSFSKHLRNQDFEIALELNYAIALTSWLTIQPAIQYIMNPAGLDDIPDAVVVGAQIIVNL